MKFITCIIFATLKESGPQYSHKFSSLVGFMFYTKRIKIISINSLKLNYFFNEDQFLMLLFFILSFI